MRRPAVALVTVLCVAALAGCGKSATNHASPANSSSATTVNESAATPAAVTATTTTPTTGAAAVAGVPVSTPARGAGGASSPAALNASPATPLAPGTYRYNTTGSSQSTGGSSKPMPKTTTLVADPAKGSSQRTTRDLRDDRGQGLTIETVLEYRPDGVHLSSIKVTAALGGGITDVRDLHADPPPLIARTGGTPGDHYEFSLTGSGTTFHGLITVQRTEPLSVQGQAVNAAVVRIHIDFSGAVTGQQDSTNWIDPAHLLNVREQVVSDAHAGALSTHTEYTAILQSLRPA